MKKLLIISLFLFGCRKTAPTPINPISVADVFKVSQISVTNGQIIDFTLQTSGKYTLTLYDTTINEVVSKEKFTGIVGNNVKKIYTTTFNQKILYLYLTDSIGTQIGKTKLLIN